MYGDTASKPQYIKNMYKTIVVVYTEEEVTLDGVLEEGFPNMVSHAHRYTVTPHPRIPYGDQGLSMWRNQFKYDLLCVYT